jgi:hypothetical protein
MRTATRQVGSVAALVPLALLASAACSSGGGTDTTEITEGADYSDGTLSGDMVGDGLEQLGDWQDLIPEGEDDDREDAPPDDGALDDWESGAGMVGSWFSMDSYSTYLSFYEDGSSYIISESGTCYGTYAEGGGGTATLAFPGCADAAYVSGTATLAGDAMEVVWSDGTAESYSQNAADQAPPDAGGGGGGGGGSSENVGEEISGIWAGDDGSFFMVIPADESGTGIANASYLAAGSATECIGILLEDLVGDGWDATVSCDEEMNGDFLFADVTLDGEALTVSWPDTGESTDYQWFSEWDA